VELEDGEESVKRILDSNSPRLGMGEKGLKVRQAKGRKEGNLRGGINGKEEKEGHSRSTFDKNPSVRSKDQEKGLIDRLKRNGEREGVRTGRCKGTRNKSQRNPLSFVHDEAKNKKGLKIASR